MKRDEKPHLPFHYMGKLVEAFLKKKETPGDPAIATYRRLYPR